MTQSVSLSNSQLAATLAEYRQRCDGPPDLVVQYGEQLMLAGYTSQLGDEVWAFYEQLFVAALHTARWPLAQSCLDALNARFPGSTRVGRLEGMLHEAKGNIEVASNLYASLLETDETNMLAAKRHIVILKQTGRIQNAITALTNYLDTYYSDQEAWMELCEYAQAIFCMEEVIVMQPQNPGFHLKYAEILYTTGQIALALKEYCRVVELSPTQIRAWYGVKLCTTQLLKSRSTTSNTGSGHATVTTTTSSSSSRSHGLVTQSVEPPTEKILYELDALATDRLSAAYARGPATTSTGSSPVNVRSVVDIWLRNRSVSKN
ncbi:hypothetical protein BDF22DRAFT_742419 [Syncephalis plumigaleata]|nr:hypothetical protein BDF22DRAFT_742419 [Syncephalis plumigaleata]